MATDPADGSESDLHTTTDSRDPALPDAETLAEIEGELPSQVTLTLEPATALAYARLCQDYGAADVQAALEANLPMLLNKLEAKVGPDDE